MIAVDTSAIVAIALSEPEEEDYSRRIAIEETLLGAPTLLECHLVLTSKMPGFTHQFIQGLLQRPTIRAVSFTTETYRIATAAFDRFGKGRGHPAQLNFGDCMSYAVAKQYGAPLLYKGEDFGLTDIASAAAA